MSRPFGDVGDPRAARALAHPLRLSILWELELGPASPADIARRIGTSVEGISYHVRRLHELGLIEADEPEIVGGSFRHVYRLNVRPRIPDEIWAQLSVSEQQAVIGSMLDRVMRAAFASAAEGGFAARNSVFARTSLALDQEGFEEASRAVARLGQELADIERRAAERLSQPETQRRDATVVSMFFGTPSTEEASTKA